MSILYGLLFLTVSVIAAHDTDSPQQQVSVTVYYESLSRICQNVIVAHVVPSFLDKRFSSLIKKMNWVPFGLAKTVDGKDNEYVCTKGQAECQGNRFHACAIKQIDEKDVLMKYISCLMDSIDVDSKKDDYPVNRCRDEIPNYLHSKIMLCYNTELGKKLMRDNARITKEFFNHTRVERFVPYLSFDNQVNDNLAAEALSNFKSVVRYLTGGQSSLFSNDAQEYEGPVDVEEVVEVSAEEVEEEEDEGEYEEEGDQEEED